MSDDDSRSALNTAAQDELHPGSRPLLRVLAGTPPPARLARVAVDRRYLSQCEWRSWSHRKQRAFPGVELVTAYLGNGDTLLDTPDNDCARKAYASTCFITASRRDSPKHLDDRSAYLEREGVSKPWTEDFTESTNDEINKIDSVRVHQLLNDRLNQRRCRRFAT